MSGPESSFHAILGRAVTDLDFRNALVSKDPERQRSALREAGIEDVSDDTLAALNEAVGALDTFAGSFGEPVEAT